MIFTSGATVYLVCRNKERGEAALSEIQTRTGNQNVHLEVLLFSCILIHQSFFLLNFQNKKHQNFLIPFIVHELYNGTSHSLVDKLKSFRN